ncbi:MAG: Rrf2 family transcriptional regulator [Acidobacteriota bacterium]
MQGFTFEAQYALVALVSLARTPAGSVKQMREISAEQGLPAPFLSKILLKLRHAGIVSSRHGRGGGYALALPASAIDVRRVVMAFGSDEPISFDLTLPGVASNDRLASGLRALNQRIQSALSATSIADLVGTSAEVLAPAAANRTAIAV